MAPNNPPQSVRLLRGCSKVHIVEQPRSVKSWHAPKTEPLVTIWLWLTVCHGKWPCLIGKPSISMGHLYHGYVSHNQMVLGWFTIKNDQICGRLSLRWNFDPTWANDIIRYNDIPSNEAWILWLGMVSITTTSKNAANGIVLPTLLYQ